MPPSALIPAGAIGRVLGVGSRRDLQHNNQLYARLARVNQRLTPLDLLSRMGLGARRAKVPPTFWSARCVAPQS
jgi:hypothetical protein